MLNQHTTLTSPNVVIWAWTIERNFNWIANESIDSINVCRFPFIWSPTDRHNRFNNDLFLLWCWGRLTLDWIISFIINSNYIRIEAFLWLLTQLFASVKNNCLRLMCIHHQQQWKTYWTSFKWNLKLYTNKEWVVCL